MVPHYQRFILAAAAVVCLASPGTARAERVSSATFFSTVEDMVTELAPRSAHAAAAIRETYSPYVAPLVLNDLAEIEAGLATGGLVPLPDPERFNIRVRLEGTSPIGEKDIDHQGSYVAARPATIGCLLDIASRVTAGPIEVTSLVRHLEYQEQLRATNANATTEVPTHALGLAFDIAIVNTPLKTVLELRDVLREMSDAGDILVIAERQQLVFHVVPQPSRLGWYTDVYAKAMTGQPWTRPVKETTFITPMVTAAISSLQPTPDWAAEWWAADNVPVDVPVALRVDAEEPALDEIQDVRETRGATGYVAILGELLSSTWRWLLPVNIG